VTAAPTHRYTARVAWHRGDAAFVDNRYSRLHRWTFDGGVSVPASSSPQVVPVPASDPEAIDPEEALVASASSCHMLWFLYIAARRGFVIDSYVDDAAGTMEKDSDGRQAITRITLRPRIDFGGSRVPSADELAAIHHEAHERCFIANSLKSEIVVEEA
jgi:organic hydroperoxide reductase OsmC/OhrA